MPLKDHLQAIRPDYTTSFFRKPEGMETDDTSRPINNGAVLAGNQQAAGNEVQAASDPSDNTQTTPANIYEWVFQNTPKVDLTPDIEKAERDRKRHLFGNVATVLGQGLGSLIGARQFTPIQNNDNYYQQRIDQLRNLQRGYDADRAKTQFQTALNRYNLEEQRRYNEGQDELKHERQKELLDVRNGYTLGQIAERNANALEQIAARGKEQQAQIQMRNDGSYRLQILRNSGKTSGGKSGQTGSPQLVDMVEYNLPKGFFNDKGKIAELWKYVPDSVRRSVVKVEKKFNPETLEYDEYLSKPTMQDMVNGIMQAAPDSPEIQESFKRYSIGNTSASESGKKQVEGFGGTTGGKKTINGFGG